MHSWVTSANDPECHFPIQNLPFGVAETGGKKPKCVSAIGDKIINLACLETAGLINAGGDKTVFDYTQLNQFMALGNSAWNVVRQQLTELFRENGNPALKQDEELLARAVFPMNEAIMHLPFKVAEYTDFYAGRQHAMNVGKMFRGSDELPANWLHIPIGYNGRASSVVVSGTDLYRPLGQLKAPEDEEPTFGPSQKVDIELEMGAVIGRGSNLGQLITMAQADEMIFGYVLLNDWSSRDIQVWEYQPLGPFQGKAFGTSIGAWVVSKEALEPFRRSVPKRLKPMLPYLEEVKPGLYDINLQVTMQPPSAAQATTICQTNYNHMYYSAAQQLTHHASSGCKMNTGDLLGSGTISGPEKIGFGSLLELCWGGKEPFILDTGETRTFIEDNDRLTLTGWAQGDGYRVGFGECTGCILPPVAQPDWSG